MSDCMHPSRSMVQTIDGKSFCEKCGCYIPLWDGTLTDLDRLYRVTAELVGPERMANNALANQMVHAMMPKDDAIRLLLDERDRLLNDLVHALEIRPFFVPAKKMGVTA